MPGANLHWNLIDYVDDLGLANQKSIQYQGDRTANRLAGPLRAGKVTDADLQAIEERRTLPMRFTQGLQLTVQRRIISRVLASYERPKPPLFLKLFGIFPILRRIPARLVGIGIRPEHVQTPEAAAN